MSLRLFLLERWQPRPLRRLMFRRLVRCTARAFGVDPPDLHGLEWHEALQSFAAFTRSEVERTAGSPTAGDADATRARLFESGRALGSELRRRLGVRTAEEAGRALRLSYAAIGIDLAVHAHAAEVVIRRCAFAAVYTPLVCDFISALDCGVVHGLMDGHMLVFTERITEGAPQCHAHLRNGPPR